MENIFVIPEKAEIQSNKPRHGRTKTRSIVVCCVSFVLALATASCGYRLSGNTEDQGRLFSPVLKRVSVEGLGRYENLRKTLVATLRGYGVKVVSPRRASARLVFDDRRERQRRSAVGDDVKAHEYLLAVEASFHVITGGEELETLLREQTVRAEAAYLSDPDRPLLTAREKREIMEDIEVELCRKIVLRLATI